MNVEGVVRACTDDKARAAALGNAAPGSVAKRIVREK